LREGDVIVWFWLGTNEEYKRFRFSILTDWKHFGLLICVIRAICGHLLPII